MQSTISKQRTSLLDTSLTDLVTVNVEVVAWAGIILFALVTRFWDLGSRAFDHDESLHALYSWYLYVGRGYKHDPMMHGPFQFHFISLLYFIFGDSDYTARIPPALTGVMIVSACLLLRPLFGRTAALLCAVALAIAPDFLYFSRFLREDIYVGLWELLAAIAFFGLIATRKARYFVLGAVAISLLYATKETVYIFGVATFSFIAFVLLVEWLRREEHGLRAAIRSLDVQTVLIGLSAALAIFAVLYTTFFTNLDGLRTGTVGAIQYWLDQQGVARGGQPWYYYLIIIPMYNFLPLAAALPGIFYFAIRRNAASLSAGIALLVAGVAAYAIWGKPLPEANSPVTAIGPFVIGALAFGALALAIGQGFRGRRAEMVIAAAGGAGLLFALLVFVRAFVLPDLLKMLVFVALLGWFLLSLSYAALHGRGERPLFTAFLMHWAIVVLIVYSWAGEKMPWLSLHITLPILLLAALFIQEMWRRVDWGSVRARGGLWLGLLVPLLGYTVLRLFVVTPFAGISIQKLDATLQWLVSLLIVVVLLLLAYRFTRGLTRGEVLHVIYASLLVVLLAFTIRASLMAAYENGDIATEMLVYAQGSPDDVAVMRDIDTLSAKLSGGTSMDVVVDASTTWPFAWYLRNYSHVSFPATLDGPPSAPVVLADQDQFDKYKPWMTNYVSLKEKLIWWFEEDYKDQTPEKILAELSDPHLRESLINILFYRKYEVPLGQWPLRKEFTFYVRKDVASLIWTPAQLPPPDVQSNDQSVASKQVNATARLSRGVKGSGDGQMLAPRGIGVAADGTIYVADSGNNRIQKLDASGQFLRALGGSGAGNGQFNEPWAVAVAPDRTIYVADTWNHRIQKFDAAGKYLAQWGTFGDTGNQAAPDQPTLLYGPRAIAVDAQGNVWVVDTGNKRVVKYDPNGKLLGAWGGLGTGPGQFAEPVGIAISASSGDVYIADTWNHRVQRFSKDFAPIAAWTVTGWDSTSVVNKPYIALDAGDNVYVTDPENHRVLEYTRDGSLLAVLGKPGADLASFNLPTGIAVDALGNIYVADSNNNRVLEFAALEK